MTRKNSRNWMRPALKWTPIFSRISPMKRFSRKHKISGCCHMIMHFRSTQLPQKRLHTGRNTQLRFVQHQYIALTAKQAFHIAASLSAQQAQPDARNSHCYRAAAPEQISQHRPSRIRSLTVGSIHSLLMVSESPRARFCVAERVFRALDRHTAQNGVDGKQGKIKIFRAQEAVYSPAPMHVTPDYRDRSRMASTPSARAVSSSCRLARA